jgi:hypothetical protein
MPDPKGNLNQHLIDTLLQRRSHLKGEQRQLKKAGVRLTEIDGELGVIGEELSARGYVDPPPAEQ